MQIVFNSGSKFSTLNKLTYPQVQEPESQIFDIRYIWLWMWKTGLSLLFRCCAFQTLTCSEPAHKSLHAGRRRALHVKRLVPQNALDFQNSGEASRCLELPPTPPRPTLSSPHQTMELIPSFFCRSESLMEEECKLIQSFFFFLI